MVDWTILSAGAVLVFVFGWNNSSFLIGNARGSGTLTLRESIAVSAAGLVLGVALEGSKMVRSLSGEITPIAGEPAILATLLVSLILTVSLTLAGLPVSFSSTMVGAYAGAAYSTSLQINYSQLGLVVTFWFLAPLITAGITFLLYTVSLRVLSTRSLLSVDKLNRLGVLATSLLIAYVLGANNIGLIYGAAVNGEAPPGPAMLAGFVFLALAGMVLLGRGSVSGTVGDRMVVLGPQGVVAAFFGSAVVIWVGTQLSVPISISQCLLGGMLGAAFSKSLTIVNGRLTLETLSAWVAAPVAAFFLALIFLHL